MKWIKIDNDSYGTILTSWCICAVLIFLTARYIPLLWLSIPLCAAMVIFMVFIKYFKAKILFFCIPVLVKPPKSILLFIAKGLFDKLRRAKTIS